MSTLTSVCEIIADVLDMEPDEITAETYLMRDLPTESIDLLEYGVGINATFRVPVKDATVFLKDFRVITQQAENSGQTILPLLQASYPHLSVQRLKEMLSEMQDGPVVQVRDIVSYVEYAQQ